MDQLVTPGGRHARHPNLNPNPNPNPNRNPNPNPNQDGNDPDIKTAPLLIYVRNNPAIAATLNAVQRWQQYYYVPLMSILDAYWRFESLQVPRTLTPPLTSTLTLIRATDY